MNAPLSDAPRPDRPPPGVLPHSAIHLLVVLGLVFITSPFIEDLPQGDLLGAVLITLVMVFAFLAVSGHRAWRTAVALVAPALTGKWVNHLRPDLLHPAVYLAAAVVFFGFVVAQLLRFIVRAPRVDANVLCAGVSGFLLLGVVWATAYLTVARISPTAFSFPNEPGSLRILDSFSAFYFSFSTLCTVGYGDITPVSKFARMLAMLEAVTGMFYMAVVISRLVSLYSAVRPGSPAPPPERP